MPVRGVLFDWGGVLMRPSPDFVPRVMEEFGTTRDVVLSVFLGPSAAENQVGGQPFAVSDLVQRMEEVLAEPLGSRAGEAAVRLCELYSDPKLQTLNDEMVGLLEELQAAAIPVALLSNGPSEVRGVWEALLGDSLPTVTWLSGERGVGKPEASAFRGVAAELGTGVEECVLIDDSPTHVGGALAVGAQGLLYDSENIQPIRDGLRDASLEW